MQVEQRRACVSCGSENAPDAAFCWRCLTPCGQTPPVPGRPVGQERSLPPPPGSWAPPTPPQAPRRAGSSKLAGAVVSIVAAAAGYFGVQFLMGAGVELPDTLAGAQRLTDPESKRFESFTVDEGDRYHIDAEGGVYGSPAAPEFFVILVEGSAVETTDQLFDALVLGFSQGGAVVDESDVRSGTRGGSEYRCVAATAGPQTSTACMWRDDDTVGIVFELSGGTRATQRLLWSVHDTVVG
jgi:hypothetical protein